MASVEVVESGKADIAADDLEEMLKARIPLNNNPRKASYLTYRATGFSVRESCVLATVSFGTVLRWRREDEQFRDYETNQLTFLQHTLVNDVQRMEWMRNFRLVMRADLKILFKANYNPKGLTEDEHEYLLQARKSYKPSELLALAKALEPDLGERPDIKIDKAIIMVDGKEVDDELAKRAAARKLLDQFNANTKYLAGGEPEMIEGQVVPDGATD